MTLQRAALWAIVIAATFYLLVVGRSLLLPFILGIVLSGILGAVVIAVFLKYLRRNSLMPFVYYRIIFGIIVIALAVFRVTAE